MSKNKHKHGHGGCCGGKGQHCACSTPANENVTENEAALLHLVAIIMEQGKKTSAREKTLYNDMMADADLTNL